MGLKARSAMFCVFMSLKTRVRAAYQRLDYLLILTVYRVETNHSFSRLERCVSHMREPQPKLWIFWSCYYFTLVRDFQEFTFCDEKEKKKGGFPRSGNKMKFKLSDDFFSASNFRKSLLKVKYVVTEIYGKPL